MFRSVICLLSLLPCVLVAPTPSYPNMKQLDPNFDLYWEANSTYIMFETRVNTTGWVGFGISETGLMFPGDVITGWVDHDHAEFGDFHTEMHGPPLKDASQDWILYSYSESKAHGTMLKFGRALNTHDTNDMVIHPGLNHVVYSYADTDDARQHTNRGSVEIDLLGGSGVPIGK